MNKFTVLDKLESGMIIGKDVIDKNTGVILIPKDTVLTTDHINKLSRHKVFAVMIKEEEILESLSNEGFSKEYSKVENRLDNIFEMVKKEGKIESEDIVNEIQGFVNEVSLERDILTQMRLLRKKDDYTFDHSLGVSILAITLGKWLGYSQDKILELAIAGLFHDIGKLKIPDEILNKPGKLTPEEYNVMKKHSYYGYEMLLKTNNFSENILQGVLNHHEKMDGSGYPNGLISNEIHEYAKIISICDIYHALTTNRVYKEKDSPLRTADYLRQESFKSLDPYITRVFINNISKFYIGNKVLLSDGTTGIIVYIYPQDETKPIVKVEDKFIDFLKEQDVEIIDIII